MIPRRISEAILVLSLSVVAAILLTYPLAFKLGHIGRIDVDDGRWSIWVIAWVARTLVADPLQVFDANIFYPHRNTLVFSEINLGGGLLGVPAYWLTRNPYATHNFVLLAGFVLSAVGMYYLCRRLTGSRSAAAVGAILFAFCPYVFGRTAHIQLLLVAGLPFSMLAFHRALDQPGLGRAITLALVLVAQAISCGYYGVFAGLMGGFGVLFFGATRGLWRSHRVWMVVSVAGGLSLLLGGLFYLPYLQLREQTEFARSLEEARAYSADWRAYLASNAWAHRWMLGYLHRWNEVLFPGFLATGLGVIGAGVALKRVQKVPRDTIVFYAVVGGVALWASFGPSAGLYTLLYELVPMFSFMRAPARFGVVVIFCLAVLAAFGVASIVRDRCRGAWIAAALTAAAAAELAVIPIRWREALSLPSPYRILATLPRGPVVEMPFFYRRQDFPRHTLYMLNSTYHWQPLINGYSDVIPTDFREIVIPVSRFPSRESFAILRRLGARYAVFHMNLYEPLNRRWALEGLEEFAPYLRLIARDGHVWLYEIIGWPP